MQQIDFRHGGPEFDAALSGRHSDDRRARARQTGPALERPGDVSAGSRPLHESGQSGRGFWSTSSACWPGWASRTWMRLVRRFTKLAEKSPEEIAALYDFQDSRLGGVSDGRRHSEPGCRLGGIGPASSQLHGAAFGRDQFGVVDLDAPGHSRTISCGTPVMRCGCRTC